jgi:hypothetical protein
VTPVGPIPLTQKKAAVTGEIAGRNKVGTPAALTALGQAPTVQFKLDNLPPAQPMAPTSWPPITARHATLGAGLPGATPPPSVSGLAPVTIQPPATAAEPPVRPAPAPRENLRRTPPPDHLRRTPPPEGARLRDSGRRPSLEALLPSGPDSKNKLRKILPQTRLTPSTAFDAVEADFFAREADLYKQEDVESFDDLDRGGPRRPGPGGPSPKKRK